MLRARFKIWRRPARSPRADGTGKIAEIAAKKKR
jgi:hypothetical protein